MDSICNIVDEELPGMVRKKVKKFRKSNFLTDVEIICQDGSVYLHKVILCQMLPEVTSLLCGNCDPHADTVFILPEGGREEVEKEVKNVYSFGLASGLKQLLGIVGGKKSLIVKTENEDTNSVEESNKIIVLENHE